ncbi:hypothetical protein QFC22_001269 [Naganishia vaughanmartiniae]|uniref:Uncharacterized protein n=1 Tax=Naganishia vaughanmartiniae TaxID=1424756 RepID=A0ACC2XI32_9TREE|nr:hypothetical protein QFC22_001269 [Naganishia vaughanmartiniae]
MSHISDADVLVHWALVASSPQYANRGRPRTSTRTSILTSSKITYESLAPRKSKRCSLRQSQAKVEPPSQSEERGLSLEDQILEQLDEQARRRTAAARLPERRHTASPSLSENTPRATYPSHTFNVLPPPPVERPLLKPGGNLHSSLPAGSEIESENNDDDAPGPSWSFATPAPPQPLRRQHLPSSSVYGEDGDGAEVETNASEADMSEVDELASTPAVGQEDLGAETEDEEEQPMDSSMDVDKTPTKAQANEVPRLLSLPQRLWSTLRPGISVTSNGKK